MIKREKRVRKVIIKRKTEVKKVIINKKRDDIKRKKEVGRLLLLGEKKISNRIY